MLRLCFFALLALTAADLGDLYRSTITETPLQQPSSVSLASSHGDGRTTSHLYVGGWGNSTSVIAVYAVDAEQRTPREVQVWETPFRQFPSVLLVSPDNKHVYVVGGSYGGPYSIYTLARSSSGELSFVTEFRATGAGPIRDLKFDPTGRRLYVGMTGQGRLGWLSRDPETGYLSNFRRIPVDSEPTALDLSPNGAHLYVVTYGGSLQLYDTTHPTGLVLLDEHTFSETLASGLVVTEQYVYTSDWQGVLTVWRRAPSGRVSMHQPIRTRLQNRLDWLVLTPFALYAAADSLGVLAWRLDNATGRVVSLDPMLQWPGAVGGLILSNGGEALFAARARSKAFQRFDIETPCGVGVPCRGEVTTATTTTPSTGETYCTVTSSTVGHCFLRPTQTARSMWCQQGLSRMGLDRVPLEYDLTQSLLSIMIETDEGYVAFALSNQKPLVAGYESEDTLSTRNRPSTREALLSLTDMVDNWRVCELRECCNVPKEGGECTLSQFRKATVASTDACASGWQVTHAYTSPGSRPDETIACMIHPPRPVTPLTLYQSTSIQSPNRWLENLNVRVTVKCVEQ